MDVDKILKMEKRIIIEKVKTKRFNCLKLNEVDFAINWLKYKIKHQIQALDAVGKSKKSRRTKRL